MGVSLKTRGVSLKTSGKSPSRRSTRARKAATHKYATVPLPHDMSMRLSCGFPRAINTCGRPPAASSVGRFFCADLKTLKKSRPVARKGLRSKKRAAGHVKSTKTYLKGAWLKEVLARDGSSVYYLMPDSRVALELNFSIETPRYVSGEAKDDKQRAKEEGTARSAKGSLKTKCRRCPATIGMAIPNTQKKFGPRHFVLDHDVTKGSSQTKSKCKGTATADLEAGHAQWLCLFCDALKKRGDSINFSDSP